MENNTFETYVVRLIGTNTYAKRVWVFREMRLSCVARWQASIFTNRTRAEMLCNQMNTQKNLANRVWQVRACRTEELEVTA